MFLLLLKDLISDFYLLQQRFIGGYHAEQCSMLVQELLENESQATSDVRDQFYGWLVLHIPDS